MTPLQLILLSVQTDTTSVAANMLKSEDTFFSGLKNLSLQSSLDKMANTMVDFAFKLVIAILVFYIGRFVIGKLYKFAKRVMMARGTDASLSTFLLSLLKITLYFILIVTVIGILGIETSSFLALFASAGVAIGMALSGTLQNFAGGVLILLLKPYRVGDFIEAQGYSGKVKAIQIFNTVINTLDNKAIIIPNGGLSTGTINNFSLEDYRRVEWTIGLSYDTDYEQAKKEILEILLSDDRVVKKYIEEDRMHHMHDTPTADTDEDETAVASEVDTSKTWLQRHLHHRRKLVERVQTKLAPAVQETPTDCSPFVGLGELADSSINITVRAWTASDNYWALYYTMNERFYAELPKKGFSFPFPQLDVHLNPDAAV